MLARILGYLAALCWGGAIGFTLASALTPAQAWGGVIACVVIGINATIWAFVGSAIPTSRRRIRAARAAGATAAARVEAIAPTSLTINDVRVYEVRLTVDPGDRAPYRAVTTSALDPMVDDVLRPGMIIAVVELDPATREVALDPQTIPGPFRDGAVVSVHDVMDAPAEGSGAVRPRRRISRGRMLEVLALAVTAAVVSYVLTAVGT